MNLQIVPKRVLYLANRVNLPENKIIVDLNRGLTGHTGSRRGRPHYVENGRDLDATGGLFIGPTKRNAFCASSYSYKNTDPLKIRNAICNIITNKTCQLAAGTKEVFAFIFGGLGNGAKANEDLIERSHSLFFDILDCIKEHLPKTEDLNIPHMIIWGKKDIAASDAIYVNNGSMVLENPALELSNKKKYTQQELREKINQKYEIVELPEDILIIPTEILTPHKNPQEYMIINNQLGKSI